MSYFFVKACALFILYLQLSVNICWEKNEWTNECTNECVLVTESTKTNETRFLPLRSSQSIEHTQQIKYWSCLLGSTFFYSETLFHQCLAAVHTHMRMKGQDVWRCASKELGMGQGAANHLLWRGSLPVLKWVHGSEEESNAPSELREPRHSSSESPSGTHQKSKNKITDASFHQALLAQTAAMQRSQPLHQHHSSKLRLEIQGRHQSLV